jgi:hypothetical protein
MKNFNTYSEECPQPMIPLSSRSNLAAVGSLKSFESFSIFMKKIM